VLLDKVKDPQAHWERLRQNPCQPTIGQVVDEAMEAAEHDNPSLKGLLARDYAYPALNNQRLGHPPDRKSRCGTAGGRCFPSTPAVWAR
jgi:type I restriction-modification system DNA methylase subunit